MKPLEKLKALIDPESPRQALSRESWGEIIQGALLEMDDRERKAFEAGRAWPNTGSDSDYLYPTFEDYQREAILESNASNESKESDTL